MGSSYSAVPTKDPFEANVAAEFTNLGRSPGTLGSIDPAKCPVLRKNRYVGTVKDMAVVRNGVVITAGHDLNLALHNVDCGDITKRWYDSKSDVNKVDYGCDNTRHIVLTGSKDASVKIWAFGQNSYNRIFNGHQLAVSGVCVLDGKFIYTKIITALLDTKFASGSRDSTIRLWDVNRSAALRIKPISRNIVTHMCFNSKARLIAQSSEDQTVKLFDKNLNLTATLQSKSNNAQVHCCFEPNGTQLLSSSSGFEGNGCEITVWDLRMNRALRQLKGHSDPVTAATFIHQNVTWKKLAISCSQSGAIKLWNAEEGQCLWDEVLPVKSSLTCIAPFHDGNFLMAGTNGLVAHLQVWGRAGRPVLKLSSYEASPKAASQP
uniref:WD_REPEATS_REGION domain-containing protein n=1 Tax=Rhabditophanes sp. KR3021 TaxID=114890 RepID=A0AC35U3H4_9BILA